MIAEKKTEETIRRKNTKVGRVVSDSMDKSVVVSVDRLVKHPLYKSISGVRQSLWRTIRRTHVLWAIWSGLKNQNLSAKESAGRYCNSGESKGIAMIQMQTMLNVADNSGAARFVVLPHSAAMLENRQVLVTS